MSLYIANKPIDRESGTKRLIALVLDESFIVDGTRVGFPRFILNAKSMDAITDRVYATISARAAIKRGVLMVLDGITKRYQTWKTVPMAEFEADMESNGFEKDSTELSGLKWLATFIKDGVHYTASGDFFSGGFKFQKSVDAENEEQKGWL